MSNKAIFNPLHKDKFQFISTTAETIAALTNEPTGFVETTTGDLADIDVEYDATARTITLTGDFEAYYQGKIVSALVTGWESAAHAAGITADVYLQYNGTAFEWTATLDLSQLLIAVVVADAVAIRWAQRECHGLMQWQVHKELHETIGTYRESGGDLSNYTVASTVAANRRPDTSLCVIDDEDLSSDLTAQLSSETYTLMYLTLTDTINFVTASDDITRLNVAIPYWNEYTGGAWTDAAMSNNFYAAWFQLAVPTTSEAGSQAYRFIWVQPQSQSLSLSSIRAVTTGDLDLGTLVTLAPELIFINKVIMRYTAADWKITEVESLTGTSKNQIGISGGGLSSVSVDGITIDGNGTPADPIEATGDFGSGTITARKLESDISTNNYINLAGSTISSAISGDTPISDGFRFFNNNNGLSSATARQSYVAITAAIKQSGTAGYTGLLLNSVETSTGSGGNYLIDLQVGSNSKFNVSTAGKVEITNPSGIQERLTHTNATYYADHGAQSDGAYKMTLSSGLTAFKHRIAALADDDTYTIAGLSSGKISVMAVSGTGVDAYIDGWFDATTAAGVTIMTAVNGVATDTDANLCAYRSGTDLVIKNRMGGAREITIVFN